MIRNFCYTLFVGSMVSLGLLGCSSSSQNEFSPNKFAFGKAGKVAILADDVIWDHAPGDTLKFYFEAAFPILPQPEPLFDLQHQNMDNLVQDPMRRLLRSYIVLVNMSDQSSDITKMVIKDLSKVKIEEGFEDAPYQLKIGKNKWAENQIFLYIIGQNESGLIDGIKESLPTFTKRLYDFDKLQYESSLFLAGHNVAVENELKQRFHIDMPIPDRFKIGIDDPPFLWLQHVSYRVTSGIFYFKSKYKDIDQFSEENMIHMRDSLTRKHITSSTAGSYMKVNNVDLPTFYYSRKIDNQFTGELRGIWQMENEFMGGAFASFLIHNPTYNEVVFVDVFVYGPGHTKRESMKQLIYLVEETKVL